MASRAILIIQLVIISFIAHAQNLERTREERELDRAKQDQIEELVRAREEVERVLRKNPLTPEEQQEKRLVIVEPNNILPTELIFKDPLIPYRARRKDWGYDVGVTYSQFKPERYESRFISPGLADFNALFGDAEIPLLELYISKKYNASLGSIGLEAAYGMYRNKADDATFGVNSLNLQTLRAGARLTLNGLMYDPVFAPYVGGGVYTAFYKEDNFSVASGGNTQAAPYYYIGALLQLNWLDRKAAAEAYVESGIENTFIFIEMRKYVASSAVQDPDFGTDFNLNAGLNLEF
jgi:hypothetical protein